MTRPSDEEEESSPALKRPRRENVAEDRDKDEEADPSHRPRERRDHLHEEEPISLDLILHILGYVRGRSLWGKLSNMNREIRQRTSTSKYDPTFGTFVLSRPSEHRVLRGLDVVQFTEDSKQILFVKKEIADRVADRPRSAGFQDFNIQIQKWSSRLGRTEDYQITKAMRGLETFHISLCGSFLMIPSMFEILIYDLNSSVPISSESAPLITCPLPQELRVPTVCVSEIWVSPNRKWLAIALSNLNHTDHLILWNLERGECVKHIRIPGWARPLLTNDYVLWKASTGNYCLWKLDHTTETPENPVTLGAINNLPFANLKQVPGSDNLISFVTGQISRNVEEAGTYVLVGLLRLSADSISVVGQPLKHRCRDLDFNHRFFEAFPDGAHFALLDSRRELRVWKVDQVSGIFTRPSQTHYSVELIEKANSLIGKEPRRYGIESFQIAPNGLSMHIRLEHMARGDAIDRIISLQ